MALCSAFASDQSHAHDDLSAVPTLNAAQLRAQGVVLPPALTDRGFAARPWGDGYLLEVGGDDEAGALEQILYLDRDGQQRWPHDATAQTQSQGYRWFLLAFEDLTGDGVPDAHWASWTGGANCCIAHLLWASQSPTLPQYFEQGRGDPSRFEADDGGLPVMLTWDTTLAYAFGAAGASTPMLEVPLRFDGQRFAPAFELSQHDDNLDAAEEDELRADIARECDTRCEELDEARAPLAGLWLGYLYSGRRATAAGLLDRLWPPAVAGRDAFAAELRQVMQDSPYREALQDYYGASLDELLSSAPAAAQALHVGKLPVDGCAGLAEDWTQQRQVEQDTFALSILEHKSDPGTTCLRFAHLGQPIGSVPLQGYGAGHLLLAAQLGQVPLGHELLTVGWHDGGRAGDTTYLLLRQDAAGNWETTRFVAAYPHSGSTPSGTGWQEDETGWSFRGPLRLPGGGAVLKGVTLQLTEMGLQPH